MVESQKQNIVPMLKKIPIKTNHNPRLHRNLIVHSLYLPTSYGFNINERIALDAGYIQSPKKPITPAAKRCTCSHVCVKYNNIVMTVILK